LRWWRALAFGRQVGHLKKIRLEAVFDIRHIYEVRPRKDHRGVNLISDALPFGYAMHSSRSHDAVVRVYDGIRNVIETHEREGDFKEP
jgi:hypothetical protein